MIHIETKGSIPNSTRYVNDGTVASSCIASGYQRHYSPNGQKLGRLSLVSKSEKEKRDKTFLYKA